MKVTFAALAVAVLASVAAAETVRIDTVQSTMPINYPVYAPVAQYAPAPVVVQSPVVVQQPIAPAPIMAPVPIVAPAPVVTYSPYYYAPAPVYYPAVRARTIVRPWGARTVYRYW